MSKCSSQQVLMRWDTKGELYFENLRIYTAPRTLIKNDVRVRVQLLLIVYTIFFDDTTGIVPTHHSNVAREGSQS